MPLSKPDPRTLTHTRVVTCQGFRRDDGLLDIEGHLHDSKPFDIPNKDRGGLIGAGEALHDMRIRITIDHELNIINAEGCIDHSPYSYCQLVAPVIQGIIGLQIGPGWRNKLRSVMGGTKGCTHLTELLGPIATTAYQTLVSEKERSHGEQQQASSTAKRSAPGFLNTCHSHALHSPVVKEHWPDHYQPKKDPSQDH